MDRGGYVLVKKHGGSGYLLEQPYREPPAAGHPRHAVAQVPPPTEGGAVVREDHRVARGGEGELERARGGADQAARRVQPGRPLRRVEHVERAALEVLRGGEVSK